MSSLFDAPIQLVMLLLLAVSGAELDRTTLMPGSAGAFSSEGPYRMSEQIWLRAVQAGAGGEELADYRGSIFRTSGGRYYVPASEHRERLGRLRSHPEVAALVAFDLARLNAKTLEVNIGRPASAGELYVAHLLGAETAVRLIAAAEKTPKLAAAKVMPAEEGHAIAVAAAGPSMTAVALLKRLTRAFAQPVEPHLQLASDPLEPGPPLNGNVALERRVGDFSASPVAAQSKSLLWTAEVSAGP